MAFWIAFALLSARVDGRYLFHVGVVLFGPLNALVGGDVGFLGFFLGVVGFWLLQTTLRHSASGHLRARLVRAGGYAMIFAWGLTGMSYLALGH